MIVLCATSQHLLAGLWLAGELQGCQTFHQHVADYDAFAKFLQQHPAMPVYLIADAVEEDYRLEHLPHTTGAAKKELITRKLNQFYRRLEYRTAHFINRAQDQRKDDRYLFAALNNADFLQHWIEVVRTTQARLVGVYLLPMLSQAIVRQLKLLAPHILLCEQLSSGLRQTYLHNGRLRMSRLLPNLPEDVDKLTPFYLQEIEKTRLYLISQRLITYETPLNLVLASTDGRTEFISQGISQEQHFDPMDLNLSALIKRLSLPLDLVKNSPELLHMQLLANGHMVDNLAPESLTKAYHFSQLKRVIKISTIVVGVLGLMLTAGFLYQGFNHQSDLKSAIIDTTIEQHRYDEAAKTFPNTTISADNLSAAVQLDQAIAMYPKSPRKMMQVVSAALEQVPEIQLNRLRWTLTHDVNIADDDKLITLPANTLQAPPFPTTDPTKLNELAFITAEIANFTGDYRGALNSAHQFSEKLKADPRVAFVEVLQEPVNASSFASLQGSTSDEQTVQAQPALFKLKVMLKFEPVAYAATESAKGMS